MKYKIFALLGVFLLLFNGLNAQKKAEKEILALAKAYQGIYLKNLDSVYLSSDFKSVLSSPKLISTEDNGGMAGFEVHSGPYHSFIKVILMKSKASKSVICVYEYNEGTPINVAMSLPNSLHFYDLEWQEITKQILNTEILTKMDTAYQKQLKETCTNAHLAENQVFSEGGEFDMSVGFGAAKGQLYVDFSFDVIIRTYANLCHVNFGRLIFDYTSGKIQFKAFLEK